MSSAIEVLKGLVEDSEWEVEHLIKQVDGRTANRLIAERDALKEALLALEKQKKEDLEEKLLKQVHQ